MRLLPTRRPPPASAPPETRALTHSTGRPSPLASLRASYQAGLHALANPDAMKALHGEGMKGGLSFGATGSGGYGEYGSLFGWSGRLLPGAEKDYRAQAGLYWENQVVLAAVNWIGDAMTESPPKIWRKTSKGETEAIPGHAAEALLLEPNGAYPASLLWKATLLSMIGNPSGEAYWYKERSNGGKVIAYWYVPHQQIWPAWQTDDNATGPMLKRYITGFWYQPQGGKRTLCKPEDVIYFRDGINPLNTRRGLGCLSASPRSLCAVNGLESYHTSIYDNGGVPGMVASPAKVPDGDRIPEMSDQFATSLKEHLMEFRGDRAGEPLVLRYPIELQAPAFSPQQLQMIEAYNIPIALILANIGIDRMVLGIPTGDRTFNNYKEANKAAWRRGVMPRQSIFADQFTTQSARADLGVGDGEWMDFDRSEVEALQPDVNEEWERWDRAWKEGNVTRAEVRRSRNLDVDEERDNVYITDVKPVKGAGGEGPEGDGLDGGGAQEDDEEEPAGKSLKGFEEQEHPRDEDGRFAAGQHHEKIRDGMEKAGFRSYRPAEFAALTDHPGRMNLGTFANGWMDHSGGIFKVAKHGAGAVSALSAAGIHASEPDAYDMMHEHGFIRVGSQNAPVRGGHERSAFIETTAPVTEAQLASIRRLHKETDYAPLTWDVGSESGEGPASFEEALRGQGLHPDLTGKKDAGGSWVTIHGHPVLLGGEGHGEGHPGDSATPAGGSSGSSRAGMHPASPDERKTLKIPPAWTDVHVADDPEASLRAVGKDEAGRTQRRYSAAHTTGASVAKFARGQGFDAEHPSLVEAMHRDSQPGAKAREEALALRLIDRTGLRVGSDAETGAKVKAYGISTLTADHVKVDGDRIELSFTGKKGVPNHKVIEDPALASELRERAAKGGRIFATTDAKVRDYLHSIDGHFKVKDFRTHNALRVAAQAVAETPAPKTAAEFKKARAAVGERVAQHLCNEPAEALKSYVDPRVFSGWAEPLGIEVKARTMDDGKQDGGAAAPPNTMEDYEAGCTAAREFFETHSFDSLPGPEEYFKVTGQEDDDEDGEE